MIYREGAAGSLYAMHDKSERRLVLTRISTSWSQVLFRAIQACQRESKLLCRLLFDGKGLRVSKDSACCWFFSPFCLFLYIFLFNPLWVHVAPYLFCLPAYGRRKCARVTDRKLFGPGNPSGLLGVGGEGSLQSSISTSLCGMTVMECVCVWNVLFSAWLSYWSVYISVSAQCLHRGFPCVAGGITLPMSNAGAH